jgi:hypothetical protein
MNGLLPLLKEYVHTVLVTLILIALHILKEILNLVTLRVLGVYMDVMGVAMNYQIWYKMTMQSKPKLASVLSDKQFNIEEAKSVANELKSAYHWAHVSVVKVKEDVA